MRRLSPSTSVAMAWRSRPLFCRQSARRGRHGKKCRFRIYTADRQGKMMRVLIVDDEPLSRSALANALVARNDIEALDSAHDAIEALEMLEEKSYDVLLLDIHMPELSGIELADRLNKRQRPIPSIVFVTAHHQHAVAAFEKHAHCVLKPFSTDRIHEALDVAVQRTESERAARLMKILPQLEGLLSKSTKIAIKTKGRILFVDP